MVKLDLKEEMFSNKVDLKNPFNSELSYQDGRRIAPLNDVASRYWTQWVKQNEEGGEDEEEADSQLYARLLENDDAKSGVEAVKKKEFTKFDIMIFSPNLAPSSKKRCLVFAKGW